MRGFYLVFGAWEKRSDTHHPPAEARVSGAQVGPCAAYGSAREGREWGVRRARRVDARGAVDCFENSARGPRRSDGAVDDAQHHHEADVREAVARDAELPPHRAEDAVAADEQGALQPRAVRQRHSHAATGGAALEALQLGAPPDGACATRRIPYAHPHLNSRYDVAHIMHTCNGQLCVDAREAAARVWPGRRTGLGACAPGATCSSTRSRNFCRGMWIKRPATGNKTILDPTSYAYACALQRQRCTAHKSTG